METHLEETNEGDVLMLPEEVSSLNLDGYVAHPFFALVVLIEYTIRYTMQKNNQHHGSKLFCWNHKVKRPGHCSVRKLIQYVCDSKELRVFFASELPIAHRMHDSLK